MSNTIEFLLTIQLCIFLDMRHAYWTKLESQQPWTRSNDCNYLAQVSKGRYVHHNCQMMELLKKIINTLYTKLLFSLYLVYGHTMLKTPVLV